MKRLAALLLATTLGAAELPPVMATIYPLQVLTTLVVERPQQVGLLIDAATGCPHDHALTPQERSAITRSRVVVANGAGLDKSVTALLGPDQRLIDTSLAIPANERLEDDHDHDHDHGHHHDHGPNPHFFASPRLAARQVLAIGEALATADPAGAVGYRRRATDAADRLVRLAEDLRAACAPLPRRHVVLQHDSLAYLARDAGLEVVAVMQEEPGQEPSAATLTALIATARQHRAVVLAEPQFASRSPALVAREAGVPLAVIDPLVSGAAQPGADLYERTMRANLERLVTALRTP